MQPLRKPSDHAELSLIQAILDGVYPPRSNLPGERDLAGQLGVTRPTLREALGRLDRDGWLTIRHGRATCVNDYWTEGGLNVLSAMVRSGRSLPEAFIQKLLEVRLVLAPAYAAAAVAFNPDQVSLFLEPAQRLADEAQAFCDFDWFLHHQLCVSAENPVFTLILNGFKDLYLRLGQRYFQEPQARIASRNYYASLSECAANEDPVSAAALTSNIMNQSLELWKTIESAEKVI